MPQDVRIEVITIIYYLSLDRKTRLSLASAEKFLLLRSCQAGFAGRLYIVYEAPHRTC